jgi:glucose-6-phosphate 1-dehydrogenase
MYITSEGCIKGCLQVTYHEGGSYDCPEGFQSLQQKLAQLEEAAAASTAGRLFYLALPPSAYTPVLQNIKKENTEVMMKGTGESWVRIIVEKPFGRDLESSEELSGEVAKLFCENQIYRIDHFLGKELSQVCCKDSAPCILPMLAHATAAHTLPLLAYLVVTGADVC